jgi:hypothetical protein
MLGVSSRITKAEAYSAGAAPAIGGAALQRQQRIDGNGSGLRVVPEPPNPWINKTQIGFYLPEATEATLTIFDETGRTIFTQTGDFAKATTPSRSTRSAEHDGCAVLQTGNG